MSNGLDLK